MDTTLGFKLISTFVPGYFSGYAQNEFLSVHSLASRASKESENLAKSKTDIGWGHQIRSYVLQPYQLVKDLRNSLENTDPLSVLDGDIDGFLEAALYKTKKNK